LTVRELAWIDGFAAGIKKYVHIRAVDRVLILPPNKVYKLNPTGLALLGAVLRGKRIKSFRILHDPEKARQVHEFFCDLRAFFHGCPGPPEQRRAVETTPFDFNYTVLPVLGEIALTYRCNNRCSFCYVGDTGAESPEARQPGKERRRARPGGEPRAEELTTSRVMPAAEELTTARVKKIIRIFKYRAGIPFFSFTGGEPLLRPDLERLIRYAVRLGLRVNLITNGTLADRRRARALRKSGLTTAQVSVESPLPDIHDTLTGIPGSFSKTIEGIRNLTAAGISVQTNTTLNRINARSIEGLPGFLKQLGIRRFSMNLYIPTGNRQARDELFFAYADTGTIIEQVKKQARPLGLTFYWYSPLPHCYYNPLAAGLGNKSCAAMDGLLSVSPAGDVLPCSSYHSPMGNLLRRDFNEIWFSARAAYFKQKRFAPKACAGCPDFTACQSACPLYWEYAGTGELNHGAYTEEPRRKAPPDPGGGCRAARGGKPPATR
jgi:radical SAM protein with 4Fe4S-binding SPASM domain